MDGLSSYLTLVLGGRGRGAALPLLRTALCLPGQGHPHPARLRREQGRYSHPPTRHIRQPAQVRRVHLSVIVRTSREKK